MVVQLPNFLIVGAPKCGTTALYHYLGQHPQVFLPKRKEPYYFVKPKAQIGKGPKDLTWEGMVDDAAEYRGLFSPATSHQGALGEASAGYLYFHQSTIPRIKAELGDPRIIIMLRDPVRRAFSSHIHHVRAGREELPFAGAWRMQGRRAELGWWFGFQLRSVSTYAESVSAFKSAFSRVLVILQEDLYRSREATLRRVFSFLGLNEYQEIDDLAVQNENLLPRSLLIDSARNRLLAKYPGSMAALVETATKWNYFRPHLPENAAAGYYRYFEDDLRETSSIIGRDLTNWLP